MFYKLTYFILQSYVIFKKFNLQYNFGVLMQLQMYKTCILFPPRIKKKHKKNEPILTKH